MISRSFKNNDAINIAAKKANVEKFQIVEYPKQKSSIEKLISSLSKTSYIFDDYIPQVDNWLIKIITKGHVYDPIQMRMEYQVDDLK